jgi:hypothetical protein
VTRPPSRLILVAALVVGACTPGRSAPTTGTGAAATPVAVTSGTRATPSASEVASPSTSAFPPDASLAADGGDPVVGQLGSFTWGGGGSDSPWLPGAPISVGTGEPLSVRLADATRIAAWTAVRAPVTATSGAGAVPAGEGSGPIAFAVADPGRWTVAVTIRFDGGDSATWFWQLDVT